MSKSLILNALLLFCPMVYGQEIPSLIPHLIQVESGGNDLAIGDSGRALGSLQIWAVVVRDVNRVYGTSFTHSDMHDRSYACSVCHMYLLFWGKQYRKNTGKAPTLEVYARMWNGGPRGYRKKATVKYWAKVKKHL